MTTPPRQLIRLAPLALVPVVLVLLAKPVPPVNAMGWVLSLASAAVFIVGFRWPVWVCVGQCGLVLLAFATAEPSAGVVQFLSMVSLAELAMRRPIIPHVLVGAAVSLVTELVTGRHELGQAEPLSTALRLAFIVGAPLLAGSHLRSLRTVAEHYRLQTENAHRMRESDAMAARTAERTAIARELHDLVAHHVASMVLRTGVARYVLHDSDPRLRRVLDDVHGTGVEALEDLRELVAVLRDPSAGEVSVVDPADLRPAIGSVVQRCRQSGHEVSSRVAEEIVGLDSVRRLAVLRVVQESITNVMRHAVPATAVRLSVDTDDRGDVHIEIADDGPAHRQRGQSGHGLIGMQERVELLGGELRAGPTGTGWRVSARIPAAQESDEVVG